MEYPTIRTSIRKEGRMWVIRVHGVTSGFIVHGGDGDNMSIEFKYDAARFTPQLKRGE